MSTSFLVLTENVGDVLGRATGTCSAAGTSSTIVDTSADSPLQTADDEQLYANAWAMIEADSAGTPLNVGEVRRITTYNPSSQTLTLAGGFSNATTTTQSYGAYQGAPPKRLGLFYGIQNQINETLRSLYYRTYHLLTLVTDGDCETSGVTGWTTSNVTVAKSTTQYYHGKQGLAVTATAANGYVRPATHAVVSEGQVYNVVAAVKTAAGSEAKLQIYDETNSAEIDSDTSKEQQWRYLYLQGTVPADCRQVSVRLINTVDAAVTYWDDIALYNTSATTMDLPSWLTLDTQIEGLYFVGGGRAGTTEDSFGIDERTTKLAEWWEVVEDHTGGQARRLEFTRTPLSGYMLVLKAIRPYAELTSDTDTTDCNADLVRAGALVRIFRDKNDREKLAYWAGEYRKLLRLYQPRPVYKTRMKPY